MLVETRLLGKRARPLDSWTIPTPPVDDNTRGEGITLRELIARTVGHEVAAYEQRERARRFVRVLTSAEIEDGASRGRIDPAARPAAEPVDAEMAVAAALQGFEDGLYLVVLDGAELRELDAQIYPTPESRLVFLRLTFLAGA